MLLRLPGEAHLSPGLVGLEERDPRVLQREAQAQTER